MGILGATVLFATTPPTPAELVAALCAYTGESVVYDEAWRLSCHATNDVPGFEAMQPAPHAQEYNPAFPYSWELLNINLKGGYLWFATLVVLQQLGGTCDWEIPGWGFMPWHLAKRESKRLFVRHSSYTYDEARRLGIVPPAPYTPTAGTTPLDQS